MKRSTIIALLLATPAYAQQPVPEQQYNIQVTASELNTISDGLQLEPFGKVLPLINKLREQVLAQQPKPVVPAPTTDTKDGSSPNH